jgi:signal transduction histidine kinase
MQARAKPLHWRLTSAIATLTAVALLVAGVTLLFYSERSFRTQKIDEVGVEARILASTVAAALNFTDRDAAQEYVDALKANPEVQEAAVYDQAGALFANYAPPGNHPLPARAPAIGMHLEDDVLAVAAPVRQGSATLGTVYVQTLLEPLSRRLARYGVIVLFITFASLLVAVLGIAQAALSRANAELERRARDLADTNTKLLAQITEREKVEAVLRQTQKMEAIGQLTGGVAHDFNNLLQVILGNLGAAQQRLQNDAAPSPDQLRRLIDAAVRGGEKAATLTQRLLAFSRRQPLSPRPLEINKLVAGMSELLRRSLGESIEIETVLAGGVWRVSADANELEAALLNLAVNARDAMSGSGKLTIETGNAFLDEGYVATNEDVAPGQYVMIAVTDTGAGMSEETRQRAFDPFFTTKDVGQGTGLGLSQVYGYVKQSGGHVKIYSEPGEGTTVKLYLPRLTGALQADEPSAKERVPHGRRDELVLVVEDDPEVRALTVETLRQLGYGVVEAANGSDALRALEAHRDVRLLFTDVGLPGGINGRALAEAARRLRPDLKVLYTTGYARNAIVHHGRLDPDVELIGKPFSYAALALKVRAILEGDTRPTTRRAPESL